MSVTIDGTDGVSKVSDDAITDQGLYDKENILGVVSESGGVPTGAIIESGSNANGEYVKYADGTLICYHKMSVDAGLTNWVYPIPFISIPPYIGGIVRTTGSNPNSYVITIGEADSTDTGIQALTSSNVHKSLTNVSVIAIGRWF